MKYIEVKINKLLKKFPQIKKVVKRVYQVTMYVFSTKIKSEGDISRVSPNDNYEYFFGYYDKSPWDSTDRYMLCLRVKNTQKDVAPKEKAEIILIDTKQRNEYKIIGTTSTWNVQQGCMLQWLGPKFDNEIIYNDFRDGNYCSVIYNINTHEERIIDAPIYSVSESGTFALTLDFSRLHRLRKGYGYYNLPDSTRAEKLPDKPCIWHIDLISGVIKPIIKYTDFSNFDSKLSMKDAEHKVNHIMLNPSGNRFMVLHRWKKGSVTYSRLVTINTDGSDMYNLSDDVMVSHCCWKDNTSILAFANKKEKGIGYYHLYDKKDEFYRVASTLKSDGHPSYSPNKKMILTDTYPDRARISKIMIIQDKKIKTIAKVFAPFKYDNDTRCDLHPRWNRKGNAVCFDAVFEGKRRLYTVTLSEEEK